MMLLPGHKDSILVLYRTILRHVQNLPKSMGAELSSAVRGEFRSHRNARGWGLKKSILRGYDLEKTLHGYHSGKVAPNTIEDIIARYQERCRSRKTTVRIKNKPSMIDSYPKTDPERLRHQQREQRLEGLINKLIITDQLRSKIPHKSELDANYVRQIYGRKVINMKASQHFRKLLQIYGPGSKPYEPKYIYNFTDKATLLSLKVPNGRFKEIDNDLYKHIQSYIKYQEDCDKLDKYWEANSRWAKAEDEWEKSLGVTNGVKYVDALDLNRQELDRAHEFRLNNSAKFHNRKVMYLRSKMRPLMEEHHAKMHQNFMQMVSHISETHVNEFNDYPNSLMCILDKHGFEKKARFNYDEFTEELDPAEFGWTVDGAAGKASTT